jgi:MazG family protein
MSSDDRELQDPSGAPDPLHLSRSEAGDSLLGRSLALVRFLRERCPWDARQDPRSLRPYLLEEAHEVADAIAAEDDDALLGELGDLLLNVAFQIVLAEERGAFQSGDVLEKLESKMRDRHPHIYGGAESPPDWEALKAELRALHEPSTEGDADVFEGVPTALEPLSRALRVQDRMAGIGFDWPDVTGPLGKVREEAEELESLLAGRDVISGAEPGSAEVASGVGEENRPIRDPERRSAIEEELGDLLFAVVNVARLARVHPSNALLSAISKFQRRSREMLEQAEAQGLDWKSASLEQLDRLWEAAKDDE